jgi:hypothetical protein
MIQVVFEPVSDREDWIDTCEVRDQSDVLVDLSAATIVLAVKDKTSKRVLLTASTTNGKIAIVSTGIFTFTFTKAEMRGLNASIAYDVGCTIELNSVTRQFFTGKVPVIHGIVE